MRWGALLLFAAACSGSVAPTTTADAGGGSGSDAGPVVGDKPTIGGCEVFPASDPWNTPVTGAEVDVAWTTKLLAHANKTHAHPDLGDGIGIPINVVGENEPLVNISFSEDDESDPGPYPFPSTVKIEGGTPTSCDGDCHVLVVQRVACIMWEAYLCAYSPGGASWDCYSGAKWDMRVLSPGQRPKTWTSADAAGLPMTSGIVRFDEVAAGHVNHAIRFTMHCTQDGFVTPASHKAVPNGPSGCNGLATATLRDQDPPMGTRVRLKSGYNTSGMPAQARAIAEAMKTYGMILADNGSDFYFQGENNPGFDNDQIDALKAIPVDQFEVLKMPPIER
jgi:hypothetical protein